MAIYSSRVNTQSSAFAENRRDMLALVDRLHTLNARGAALSEKRRDRFESRGLLLPRG